jgi:thymidylate kinase
VGRDRPKLAGASESVGLTVKPATAAGWVITVAGPDGAGKTTFCDAFIDTVPAGRPLRRFHHRFELVPARSDADPAYPHEQSAYAWPVSVAKVFALYAEAFIGWNTKVRGFTKRGGYVVIERGWWDLAVDPVRYRLRPHPRLVRTLGRLLPQSDLLIVLEGTIELLMSRTTESTEQEIEDQTKAWRNSIPGSVPRVYLDVSSPVEELVRLAEDELARVLPPDTLRSR